MSEYNLLGLIVAASAIAWLVFTLLAPTQIDDEAR